MENNFMLFVYSSYYPQGGHEDYIGRYPTAEAAFRDFSEKTESHEWYGHHASIYDIANDRWFYSWNRGVLEEMTRIPDPTGNLGEWAPVSKI